MRKDRREKLYKQLRAPGTRRVLEALELVSEEMTDFDDDLPKMPGERCPSALRLRIATVLALLAVMLTDDDRFVSP